MSGHVILFVTVSSTEEQGLSHMLQDGSGDRQQALQDNACLINTPPCFSSPWATLRVMGSPVRLAPSFFFPLPAGGAAS